MYDRCLVKGTPQKEKPTQLFCSILVVSPEQNNRGEVSKSYLSQAHVKAFRLGVETAELYTRFARKGRWLTSLLGGRRSQAHSLRAEKPWGSTLKCCSNTHQPPRKLIFASAVGGDAGWAAATMCCWGLLSSIRRVGCWPLFKYQRDGLQIACRRTALP